VLSRHRLIFADQQSVKTWIHQPAQFATLDFCFFRAVQQRRAIKNRTAIWNRSFTVRPVDREPTKDGAGARGGWQSEIGQRPHNHSAICAGAIDGSGCSGFVVQVMNGPVFWLPVGRSVVRYARCRLSADFITKKSYRPVSELQLSSNRRSLIHGCFRSALH